VATSAAFEWLDALQGSGIRPGLGRIRALLRALGNPHRAYPSIIIAGTNGKGSTSATLASILNAALTRTTTHAAGETRSLTQGTAGWAAIGRPPVTASTATALEESA